MVVEVIETALVPLADTLGPVISRLSVIVGGIFGLYIILIIVRIYYERKKLKVLQAMRYDLDQLNLHHNIPNSRGRKGVFKKVGGYFTRVFNTEIEQVKKKEKSKKRHKKSKK